MAQKTTVMKLTAWYINKFNNINTDQLLIYLYIMVIALDMHLEKVKYMHINLPITNVYCFFQNMYISKLYNSAWTEADSKTDSSILTCVVHFQVVWCSTDWHWQQNKQLYSYLCGTFPSCMMQHELKLAAKQSCFNFVFTCVDQSKPPYKAVLPCNKMLSHRAMGQAKRDINGCFFLAKWMRNLAWYH